jgi:steroid delta-isomerase-like uncharacterized protein
MSEEQNKKMLQRFVEEVLNQGNLDVMDELFAADGVTHALPPGIPPNREGYRMFLRTLRVAFPDLHVQIEDMVAEGDKVVNRATGSGTMQGEFLGMPPTGQQATWPEIHIWRFAGDQIVEQWGQVDMLGLLQQLGAIPTPGQGA